MVKYKINSVFLLTVFESCNSGKPIIQNLIEKKNEIQRDNKEKQLFN